MYLRRDQNTRIARAPAKLNLYLEILGRRADRFHELETLMVPLRLSDSLGLTSLPLAEGHERGALELRVRECYPVRMGPLVSAIPTDSNNLVMRALDLLRERSGCELGARVLLTKRIPAGAGLGGGSSDAAAVLRLANRAWRLDWPVERLAELAAEIGSDVPFFIYGGTAICRGRGERVEPLRDLRTLHFVVVKPPVSLSTADVYRAYDAVSGSDFRRETGGKGSQPRSASLFDFRKPGQWMRNRLQEAAGLASPWIGRLQAAFDRLDVAAHQLSGSGSAYFGVCRHAQHARRLANILRTQQLGLVYATRSCA